MKKKRIMKLFPFIVLLLVFSSRSLFACTSFAVYTDKTFYGMNFDYEPFRELKFCIDTRKDIKTFDMQLQWEGGFTPIVAMNTKGLFGNLQMLFPEVPAKASIDPGELRISELLSESTTTLGSCQDVIDVMSDYKIVMGTVSLHSLYADVYGDAMVVEVGQKDNVITKIEGNFIVMTNFPINEVADKPYENVYGAGSDRYKTAYAYLAEHANTFDLDDGFYLLKSVVSQGMSATRCSMVFDPENNDVYIALEGNFDMIWKISLESETVETFKGFDEHFVMDIGDGVFASELKALESGIESEPEIEPTISSEYILVGLILIGAILFIGYKRRTRI